MLLPSEISSLCFTGHRDLSKSEINTIYRKLNSLLDYLYINRGLRHCYAGGAIGFDTVAAQVVLNFRIMHPEIKLHLILPCSGQERKWTDEQKQTYNDIKTKANNVRVLAPFYFNGCMQARNKELLLSSDLCIAYLRNDTSEGGSLNTVLQATKMGIPIINLADPESELKFEINQQATTHLKA